MKVVRVDQSPANPRRWCLTLSCGHEVWVTSKSRPKREQALCPVCDFKEKRNERVSGVLHELEQVAEDTDA